jgi:Mannosyl-glycoprotein endo-beta-N-acetylglucosaminidase
VLAQLHMDELHASLAAAQANFAQVAGIEAKVQAFVDTATVDRDAKRKAQTDAAAAAYVQGGVDQVGDTAQISGADASVSAESVRILAGSAIDHTHDEFLASETWMQITRAVLRPVQLRSAQARAALDAAQHDMDEANAAILQVAGGVVPVADLSPTVLGAPTLTADEIAGWYQTKGIVGWAGGVDVRTMAGFYLSEGLAEGVRGDIAFAQAMVETGAFTSPLTRHNNFAGIGACDSCATGYDFESPQLGVRAQMQLLHAYADRSLSIVGLANPAVGADPDHLSVRGCCPTWNKLTGTWATDPNYGPKIMTVYVSMLQYAAAQRTAALAAPAPPPAAAPVPGSP